MTANQKINAIKAGLKDEGSKTGLVVLGAIAGKGAGKLIDLLIEKYPDAAKWATYIKPIAIAGGGLAIAVLNRKQGNQKESNLKYFGYGVAAAGVLDGLKLIPLVGDYLSGLDTGEPNAYYTEDEFGKVKLGNFGLAELPVNSLSLQEAETFSPELPELEIESRATPRAAEKGESDLGYNPSQTDDVDLFGIL